MPNKRPIPQIDPKSAATPGAITIKPWMDGKSVGVEVHHCTIFLEQKEALAVLLSLSHACMLVWGDTFIKKFLTYTEQL